MWYTQYHSRILLCLAYPRRAGTRPIFQVASWMSETIMTAQLAAGFDQRLIDIESCHRLRWLGLWVAVPIRIVSLGEPMKSHCRKLWMWRTVPHQRITQDTGSGSIHTPGCTTRPETCITLFSIQDFWTFQGLFVPWICQCVYGV